MIEDALVIDSGRLTVHRDFVWLIHRARLDTFEAWYDESLVGAPLRHTGDRANVRVELDAGDDRRAVIFLKRHEPMSLARRISSMFRLGHPLAPARAEWHTPRRLPALGMPTGAPVALGEDPATGRSFVAVAEIEHAEPADDFARERLAGRDRFRARVAFVRKLAETVRRLHAARLVHRDLYLCHVFVEETGSDFRLHLIDLQRLGPFRLPRWRVKDVAQLEFSRPAGVFTRTDRVRFLRAYFGVTRLGGRHKHFARAVLRKTEQIRRREAAKDARP